MDSFPLNSNGKVSRSELPAPTEEEPPQKTHPVEDMGEVEVRLLTLYKRALNVEDVHLDDNFFDLGGIRCWPRRS
jgi:hypothetical protein